MKTVTGAIKQSHTVIQCLQIFYSRNITPILTDKIMNWLSIIDQSFKVTQRNGTNLWDLL